MIVLLGGFDEVYPYLSNNLCDDTAKSWTQFFRVARLLSTTGFKLVVASSAPLLFLTDETSDSLFELSTRTTNEEVLQLIYPPNTLNQRPKWLAQSTDTYLYCVFELLQYNRLALKSQSGSIRGNFYGLDAILLWDDKFDEDSNYVLRGDLMESRAAEI